MFALGFQEIVPLTAQQIVQTDPEKKYALTCPHSMTAYSLLAGAYGKPKSSKP